MRYGSADLNAVARISIPAPETDCIEDWIEDHGVYATCSIFICSGDLDEGVKAARRITFVREGGIKDPSFAGVFELVGNRPRIY